MDEKEYLEKLEEPQIQNGIGLYNLDKSLVCHLDAQAFINAIYKAHKAGFGFLPIIGAGFSASAGVPVIAELAEYLERCIARSLGINDKGFQDRSEPWNPRTDQWPPFVEESPSKKGKWRQAIQLALEKQVSKKDSPEASIYQEALGAAAEWRSSLLFLSRIAWGKDSVDIKESRISIPKSRRDLRLRMLSPKQETVDACFRHLIKGKQPSLNHMMLAVLSTLLRIDLIVSTNFDDFLERAFSATGDHLDVFEVHVGDLLPAWSAVSHVRALVKINGGKHSLLANYTLDDTPHETDRQNFLNYILCKELRPGFKQTEKQRNHLLVLGVGASEPRTLELIRHARNHLSELEVFWVCYSKEDIEKVEAFWKQSTSAGSAANGQCHILCHQEVGLLLLQLDQEIRKTLPPIGAVFPTLMRHPTPPMPSVTWAARVRGKSKDLGGDQDLDVEAAKKFTGKIAKKMRTVWTKPSNQRKLVTVSSLPDVHGITSACAEVFRENQRDIHCLWIELNDIYDVNHLFEVFLEAAYLKLGRLDWTPVYTAHGQKRPRYGTKRDVEIRQLMESSNKEWILFLDARETPGSNRNPNPTADINGWLDEKLDDFTALIDDLCGPKSSRLSVLLLCTSSRLSRVPRLARNSCQVKLESSGSKSRGPEKIAAQAIHWAGGDPQKTYFLQTLISIQRPRLLSTLWSTCIDPEQVVDPQNLQRWLFRLEEIGLIRWQEGGILWIHARNRDKIRYCLGWEKASLPSDLPDDIRKAVQSWGLHSRSHEIHKLIAQWYLKVFRATNSPVAVFEAVDHLCYGARHLFVVIAAGEGENLDERLKTALQLLSSARNLLRSNHFLIKTHGYAIGSCRRLLFIRNIFSEVLHKKTVFDANVSVSKADREELIRAIGELQRTCVTILRSISREIGELTDAYQYHRELRYRLKNEKTICGPDEQQWALQDGNDTTRNDSRSFESSEAYEDVIAAVRWWRWSGTLAHNARNLGAAESALSRALHCLSSGNAFHIERSIGSERTKKLPAKRVSIAPKLLEQYHVQAHIELLRVLEKCVEVFTLQDSGIQRANGSSATVTGQKARSKALLYVKFGIEVADHICNMNDPTARYLASEAMWFKAQLLAWWSFILSCGDPEDVGLPKTMGLLDEAQSCLLSYPSERNVVALAHIELRRAAIRLRQAGARKLTQNRKKTFNMWSQSFWMGEPGDSEDLGRVTSRPEFDRRNVRWLRKARELNPTTAHQVFAKATDALRFLDRAEPILKSRRRNVWWTTWYWDRRLQAIANVLWACVNDCPSPIPFLGLEAAPSHADTEPDILLRNATRMIRLDSFRLAATIHAYCRCISAFQVRLALDAKAKFLLNYRLRLMCRHLTEALNMLSGVERHRQAIDDTRDRYVETFIRNVMKSGKSLLFGLNGELAQGFWVELPVATKQNTGTEPLRSTQQTRSR